MDRIVVIEATRKRYNGMLLSDSCRFVSPRKPATNSQKNQNLCCPLAH